MRINSILKAAIIGIAVMLSLTTHAQPMIKMLKPSKEANFYEVQHYFDQYFKLFDTDKGEANNPEDEEQDNSYKVYKRWESFMEPRVFPSGKLDYEQHIEKEYEMLKHQNHSTRGLTTNENWILDGPALTIPTGGGAGRINGLTVNPLNHQSIWAGAPSGGLWHSTDGGSTWTTNTDLLPVLGVSCIAIDPLDTTIMYISTGDGDAGDTYSIGLMKSVDAGANWNLTGMSNYVAGYGLTRKILIYPTQPNLMLVCTDNAIYQSHDAGATWTQPIVDNFFDMKFKVGHPSTIYASSTTAVYMSTDTGATWTHLTDSLPTAGVGRIALATTEADSNIIYAMCTDGASWGFYGLYRSLDAGMHWTMMSDSPNVMGWDAAGGDAGGQGWYTLSIAATGTDTVYVGGVDIWRSTDGGANWACNAHWYGANGLPYVHADIHDLSFYYGKLYSGCDGGVFVTDDGGSTWQDKSNGLDIAQYYRFGNSKTNPVLFYAGAQDNGTARYNGGVWTQALGGDGMEALVDYTNENIVYGTSQNGYIYHSTDAGANYYDITPPGAGAWVTPYAINPQNHNGLFYGGASTIYKTWNQGATWIDAGQAGLNGAGYFNAVAIAPTDSNFVLVSSGNRLFKTIFGGGSWENLTPYFPVAPTYITYIAFDNTDKNHFWVSCSGGTPGVKVFETTDAGYHWDNVSDGLPNISVNTIVHEDNSKGVLYAGTDLGIYYKNDYLSDWIPVNAGLPHVIVDELEFQYNAGVLRAATFGRGVWESDTVTTVNYSLDAGVKRIENPPLYICTNNLIPGVTIKNYGTTAITDMNVVYKVDNGSTFTYTYNGSLSSLSTVTLNLSPITILNAGQHTLTVFVQHPNGVNDDFMNNDTLTSVFNYVPGDIVPVFEDYETAVFPPHKWQINNPDNSVGWEPAYLSAYGKGFDAMLFDNYYYNAVGQLDNFVSPLLNFTGLGPPIHITWDMAYARYPGYSDSLFVKVSTDCGENWTRVYAKGDSELSTAPDVAYPFAPDSTQWRNESANLASFSNMSDVMVEFTNWNGYGNYLYIDNVNIIGDSIVLPNDVAATTDNVGINIYPNPGNGLFILQINSSQAGPLDIAITDMLGRQIIHRNYTAQAGLNQLKFDLTTEPTGVYYVSCNLGGKQYSKKVVVVR